MNKMWYSKEWHVPDPCGIFQIEVQAATLTFVNTFCGMTRQVNVACRSLLPKTLGSSLAAAHNFIYLGQLRLSELLKDNGILIVESWAKGNEKYATPKDPKDGWVG